MPSLPGRLMSTSESCKRAYHAMH